jgi:hypothetical protein
MTQSQIDPQSQQSEFETPVWQQIEGTDVQVLRGWPSPDGKFPEVSVLRTSHATYTRFAQESQTYMNFLNDNKVFSKDVIFIGPWVTLSSAGETNHPPNWVLSLMHGKKSTVLTAALPQLTTDDDSCAT